THTILFLPTPPPPRPPLFPYTTLFRSASSRGSRPSAPSSPGRSRRCAPQRPPPRRRPEDTTRRSPRCAHGMRSSSRPSRRNGARSEEHTSELQSPDHLVCRLLLEKKKN